MTYNMTEGGKEERKTNKKFRRTKPLTHWAFLCNLQGKFLRSESHLWGFSTSPLLRKAEAIADTDPPQRSDLSDKRLLLLPPSFQGGTQCTDQCLCYC